MRTYDKNKPLIVLHIPKTAGTSFRELFQSWFQEGFLPHYYDETAGRMPKKYDLDAIQKEKPVVVHGHFNRLRKFGVADYYPQVDQFITILRDPFEMAISTYFYTRKVGSEWKDQSRVAKDDLRTYLFNVKPNMLNQFPCQITMANYQEVLENLFIEIGVTEHLSESMQRIACKLGMPYSTSQLGRLNATERIDDIPYDIKEEFKENNPLEYAVYEYALNKYVD